MSATNEARIIPKYLAERFAARDGEAYRPSNGTEGSFFEAALCEKCKHDSEHAPCKIFMMMMAFDTGDDEYPPELIYSPNGYPSCTAFCAPEPQKPPSTYHPDNAVGDMFTEIEAAP